MTIRDLLNKLLYKMDYTYYINDKITDLDMLIDCNYEVDNFAVENNVFRIYSSEYE